MTNFPRLRRSGRRPAPAGRPASAWSPTSESVIVLLALIAATFFAALQLTGSSERVASVPEFLASALGSPQGETDATVHKPAPGVQVDVDQAGYTVHRAGASVSVTGEGSGTAGWAAFENGASRRTPFGHETITIQPDKTELYLTVVRHQGVRNWRWRLDAAGLQPRLEANGGVRFVGLRGQSAISIHPVAILDASGREITPAGLRWSLVHDDKGWWLGLRLDDRKLPLPYVIDPAANYPTPLNLRSTASAVTGSWDPRNRNRSRQHDVAERARERRDRMVRLGPGRRGHDPADGSPDDDGWQGMDHRSCRRRDRLPRRQLGLHGPDRHSKRHVRRRNRRSHRRPLQGNDKRQHVHSDWHDPQPYRRPGRAEPPTGTNAVTTTATYSIPKFSLAAGETLFVDYWRHQSGSDLRTAGCPTAARLLRQRRRRQDRPPGCGRHRPDAHELHRRRGHEPEPAVLRRDEHRLLQSRRGG